MSPLPDPGELLAIADRIAAHARSTRDRAGHLAAGAGAARWHGTAADAFHGQVRLVVSGLRRSADRLDDAADALRRHAYRVMEKLAHLADLGPDVLHLGEDVLHGVRDYLVHPTGLVNDSISIITDTSEVVTDVVGVLRPR
jgi:uncharacterized protein YukE